MQTTSTDFENFAKGNMRPLSWNLFISFDKELDSSIEFFTIETSEIEGGDFIKPDESDVVQEWDKYIYVDYSDRVIDIEVVKEVNPKGGLTLNRLDFTLDNHDDFFTTFKAGYITVLEDDFTSLNPAVWNYTVGVSIDTARLKIQIPMATVGVTRYIKTLETFHFSEQGFIKLDLSFLTPIFTGTLVWETFFPVMQGLTGTASSVAFYINSITNTLFAVKGSIPTSYSVVASISYSVISHKYFRIRYDTGTIYWEYSTNGVAWTELTNESGYGASNITAEVYYRKNLALGTDINLIIDNFLIREYRESNINTLPYRPVRFLSGFNGENVPQFIGLTEGVPRINSKTKTISFQCIDFWAFILDKSLDESIIFIDKRTDEILETLMDDVGIISTQRHFDIGFNLIKFAYFEKGEKLLDAINKLMEAEGGRLFMDELGFITFRNRQGFPSVSTYTFEDKDIVDYTSKNELDITNIVVIKGKAREVQPLQQYGEINVSTLIQAGASAVIWISFDDPVTTVIDPVHITSAISSFFETNLQSDGGGDIYTDISLIDSELFGTSFKMTFENTGSSDAYITKISLYSTPAFIINDIYLRQEDLPSIQKYNEQIYEIDNDFFQTYTDAQSKALLFLTDFSILQPVQEVSVKGNPALQIDDVIDMTLPGNEIDSYRIRRIVNKYDKARFTQLIQVNVFNPIFYFTIETSEIGGTDQISP